MMLTDRITGFVWDDYSKKYKDLIDRWTDDEEVQRFATDDSWHDEYMYYMTETERYMDDAGVVHEHKYELNKDFFCKIIFDGETPVAVIILLSTDGYPVYINPLLVNPKLWGRGYGTEIIRELIDNIDELIPNHSDTIEAGVDIENTPSRRIFEKNGFTLTKIHPEGDFLFYQYQLPEEQAIQIDSIKDIKNIFNKPEMFRVYSDCMYMPTFEKFMFRANELMENDQVFIFAYIKNSTAVGIIAVERISPEEAEIKGIAVDESLRKHGVGKKLIQYALETMKICTLYAETDDDAVDFYRHCGFETEAFMKNDEYKRYHCILKIDKK